MTSLLADSLRRSTRRAWRGGARARLGDVADAVFPPEARHGSCCGGGGEAGAKLGVEAAALSSLPSLKPKLQRQRHPLPFEGFADLCAETEPQTRAVSRLLLEETLVWRCPARCCASYCFFGRQTPSLAFADRLCPSLGVSEQGDDSAGRRDRGDSLRQPFARRCRRRLEDAARLSRGASFVGCASLGACGRFSFRARLRSLCVVKARLTF